MVGRPRGFDRGQALDIAMRDFWRDGYGDTTVAGLTRDMGISVPSLYAAFGDKDALFAAAASCYFGTVTTALDDALARHPTHDAIAALVRVSVASYADRSTPSGCFVLSEPRLVDERLDMVERIRARVAQGVLDGDVPPATDPETVASFVVAVLSGVSSRARDGGTADELTAVAEFAIRALGW